METQSREVQLLQGRKMNLFHLAENGSLLQEGRTMKVFHFCDSLVQPKYPQILLNFIGSRNFVRPDTPQGL